MASLCECGCGEPIPENPRRRRPARFRPGHHVRLAAQEGRPQKPAYQPTPEETPSGVCECGCGERTAIARVTHRPRRWFRGYPLPYLPGHSKSGRENGPRSCHWRGGRYLSTEGYVMVWCPDDPAAESSGYAREHRLVAQEMLGRALAPGEVVHHRNGVKSDNRPENLEVMSHGRHTAHHAPARVYTPESRARMADAGRKGADVRWKRHG